MSTSSREGAAPEKSYEQLPELQLIYHMLRSASHSFLLIVITCRSTGDWRRFAAFLSQTTSGGRFVKLYH
jgi:hypothetical protein